MKTTAEYIAASSDCPRCNSSDINAGSLDVDCGSCGQEVNCEACGLSWWDEYTLTGYTVKHAPEWKTPADYLADIHGAMDGQEWDSATTSKISEILTAAGYTVREPLLASDFGEVETAPESERGKA